jgi:nucleotide-binding universal stress UspA family protein
VPYRCIVVGTDGSETSAFTVGQAAAMAAAADARLVVVTAWRPEEHRDTGPSAAPDEIRWMLTDANEADETARRGRAIAREAGVADVVVLADRGEPAEVLIGAARTFDADLIVVGSRGLASPARFLLGSVASEVSHHAPCDVLIAHSSG